MRVLNIGVIGCGAIGREHIRRLSGLVPGARVAACSDFYREAAEKAARLYGIDKIFDTGTELIASGDTDAVLITSPDETHAGYVLDALKLGKHVFCEKPLAITAADCERIISEEAKHGKRLVQVGFMRRYDRGYVEIKRILDSGELGSPLMIHACHRNVSQGDGFITPMGITNVAIHELDACRWLLGEEYSKAQVLKVRQSSLSVKGYDNPQIALLETESGRRIDIEIQCSDAYGYDIQCEVVCEMGAVGLPDPPAATVRAGARVSYPILTDWSRRFVEAYDAELTDWVRAARDDKLTGPSSWDGYAACVAADALNKSRGTERFVEINMINKPEMYKQDYA